MKRKHKLKKKVRVREKKIGLGPFKLIGVVFLVLFAGFLTASSAYLTSEGIKRVMNSPYFHLKTLKISGLRLVPEERIISAVNKGKGTMNIFSLNPKEIRREILKESWINDVSVKRIFPDTLVVEVEERIPVARIHLADGEYLLDRNGVPFVRHDGRFPDLPLILGDFTSEDIASVSEIIESLKRAGFHVKELLFAENLIVAKGSADMSLKMGRDDLGNLKYLPLALSYIKEKGLNPKSVDLRFPEKAILQF